MGPLCLHRTACLALVAALSALPCAAAVLNIDFGHQDRADGFESFTLPGGTYGSAAGNTLVGPLAQSYASAIGVGGNITVTLSAAGGNDTGNLQSFFGGYLAAGVAYADVADDCVYNIGGTTLDLELGVLEAGRYTVDTYLHSSNYGNQGTVDIYVNDRYGQRQIYSQFQQSQGTAGPVARATMVCVSDGINPVTIHFEEATSPKNVVLAGVSITDLPPDPLKVDFGHSTVEAGFELFHTPGGVDTGVMSSYTVEGPVSQTFSNGLGKLGEVTVTLSSGGRGTDGGTASHLQSFNSGDMSGDHPYRDLGKDIIYNLMDDWLEVTLSDLDEGVYAFDAFLHSSYSAQGDVNIDVTDRLGAYRRVLSDFTQSSDSGGPVAQASFYLYADGENDVVIRFTETPELPDYGSKNVVMAGFILSVPEPGTWLLLSFALVCGALVRRRRAA